MNNIKGSLILLLAAFIWGTAFVAQTSGAGAVGTFTFNAARSIVGALFLAVVIVIKNVLDKRNNSGKVINTENESHLLTWPLGAGIICGIVLFAAMTFQQYGISVYPQGVAASGRSGFITATYVVMVSVVSVFMGKKMHWIIGVSVAGCVAGMYLYVCLVVYPEYILGIYWCFWEQYALQYTFWLLINFQVLTVCKCPAYSLWLLQLFQHLL